MRCATARKARLRGLLVSMLLAACALANAARADERLGNGPSSALQTYVGADDASYAWRVRGRYRHRGAELIELELHSQTWRGGLWKHQLILIKPRQVAPDRRGLLIVGGGRWREEQEALAGNELPEDGRLFVAIAQRLDTVVAVLGQVPFQPLFDKTEDNLIAYTFDQYLKTGDDEWPLLLPMVKSVVRALDATTDAAGREWQMPLEQFTVLGGSKRGWTAWLAAALDSRITAVAPAVIDVLNMREHFPYQTATWGGPSEEIRPYSDLGLHTILGSEAGAALRDIVDPYEYRESLTIPKLVVVATNDRYFPVDSANLYWDALEGEKYLLYLPNDEHSISDYRRLIASLRALHAAGGEGPPCRRWSGSIAGTSSASSSASSRHRLPRACGFGALHRRPATFVTLSGRPPRADALATFTAYRSSGLVRASPRPSAKRFSAAVGGLTRCRRTWPCSAHGRRMTRATSPAAHPAPVSLAEPRAKQCIR